MEVLERDVWGLGEGVDHSQQGIHLELDRLGSAMPRDVLHRSILVAFYDGTCFALFAPSLNVSGDENLGRGMVVVGFGEVGQEVFQSFDKWIHHLCLSLRLVGIYHGDFPDRIGHGVSLFESPVA